MPIVKVWNEELKEHIETFVDEKEFDLKEKELPTYKNTIKIWTDKEIRTAERKYFCDKYNVKYGTRFYNLDASKDLTETEFEIMCYWISKGKSLADSYRLAKDYLETYRHMSKQVYI